MTSSNENTKQQQNNGSLAKEQKTTPDRPTINQTVVQFTDLSRSNNPYRYTSDFDEIFTVTRQMNPT